MAGRSPEWLAVVNRIERLRGGDPVLLAGEAGVGKTSLAVGSPYRVGQLPPRVRLVDAAERHIVGTLQWLTQLREAMS
ncbi:hypothetical protein, partial [Proteus terrae]|uniref:hypothetical protein n=1 Tax=Proteus terrae TaxID=1574161 RepID=UPI00301BF31D